MGRAHVAPCAEHHRMQRIAQGVLARLAGGAAASPRLLRRCAFSSASGSRTGGQFGLQIWRPQGLINLKWNFNVEIEEFLSERLSQIKKINIAR